MPDGHTCNSRLWSNWTTSTGSQLLMPLSTMLAPHRPSSSHTSSPSPLTILSMHFIAFCRTGNRRTLSFQWQRMLQCLLFILYPLSLPPSPPVSGTHKTPNLHPANAHLAVSLSNCPTVCLCKYFYLLLSLCW